MTDVKSQSFFGFGALFFQTRKSFFSSFHFPSKILRSCTIFEVVGTMLQDESKPFAFEGNIMEGPSLFSGLKTDQQTPKPFSPFNGDVFCVLCQIPPDSIFRRPQNKRDQPNSPASSSLLTLDTSMKLFFNFSLENFGLDGKFCVENIIRSKLFKELKTEVTLITSECVYHTHILSCR